MGYPIGYQWRTKLFHHQKTAKCDLRILVVGPYTYWSAITGSDQENITPNTGIEDVELRGMCSRLTASFCGITQLNRAELTTKQSANDALPILVASLRSVSLTAMGRL